MPRDSHLGDTWAWDGSAWNRIDPSATPSPRWGITLGYHDREQRGAGYRFVDQRARQSRARLYRLRVTDLTGRWITQTTAVLPAR